MQHPLLTMSGQCAERQKRFSPILFILLPMMVGCATRDAPTTPDSAETAPPGSVLEKCGIVLPLGPDGAWDAGMVESPAVWYDSTSGRYGMVYTGYDRRYPDRRGYPSVGRPQIGLAWSDDLLRWNRDARSPIFRPSQQRGTPDEAGAAGPFIWYEDGTYYLFYFGTTEAGYEGGRKTMNLATSPDLLTWTRYGGNPIIEPAGDGWRRDAIWHPNVVREGESYYLFFNASGVVDGRVEEFIGYATSPDLFDWTVHDEYSPILVGSDDPGTWDSAGRAGDPSLYRVGNAWYMAWYGWDKIHAQDGLAMTTADAFPLGWDVYGGNPVVRIGEPGSFDALHAHKPFVYRTEDHHYHYYTAVDTAETRQIALAASPGAC